MLVAAWCIIDRPRNRYYRKPGLLGHFGHFWKNRPFRPFWPTNSEQGWTSRRNFHLGSGLAQRERARSRIRHVGSFAGGRSKTATWGVAVAIVMCDSVLSHITGRTGVAPQGIGKTHVRRAPKPIIRANAIDNSAAANDRSIGICRFRRSGSLI